MTAKRTQKRFATVEVSLKSRSKRLWPDIALDDPPKFPNRLLGD